jgi:hypothetical protein
MRFTRSARLPLLAAAVALGAVALVAAPVAVQPDGSAEARRLYTALHGFSLTGGSASVTDFVLTRDRAVMTFTGTFYFAGPVADRVTGAVFVGEGTMRAEVPPSTFEREHVERMIGADVVESDFRTAVLRWTDDTFDQFDVRLDPDVPVTEDAARLASDFEGRLTVDTGVNLAARLALSILNEETPGLFFAQFNGGRRDRFNVLLDHQQRIPVANFGINGGEKGLIFAYKSVIFSSEIWMAFYSEDDYALGSASYSDVHNVVDITHYEVAVNLTAPEEALKLVARIEMDAALPNVRAVPFRINETLNTFNDARREFQLHVTGIQMDGQDLDWTQEDWEGGFTVYLPRAVQAGESLAIDVGLEGQFLQSSSLARGAFYLVSNTGWLPRHGELDRATFDLHYLHRKRDKVASVGTRISEDENLDDPERMMTSYRMRHPVALVVFAVGPFERHIEEVVFEAGGDPIPLEFNALPDRLGPIAAVKEEFILAELNNSVRYFSAIFGQYPYDTFGAAFHPYNFGQGFPTMLMLAPADRASSNVFAFLSHEAAHQWWGNIVAWRSYRDQWLSEGFAEYSGVLYTDLREKEEDRQDSADELIRDMRRSLLESPVTLTGVGSGRLNDIGPIILGRRLASTKSRNGYQALTYNKGGLVLRMLHYLLSDPTEDPIASGDPAFHKMMTDFVERHRNGEASSDDFRVVANQHFRASPIALRNGLGDLNWFFLQWVYQTGLPSYELEYELSDQDDGSVIVSGTLTQENVPDSWFMALPVVFTFDGDQTGRTAVAARGPSTPFQLRLPMRPRRVELDPEHWILSENTDTRRR